MIHSPAGGRARGCLERLGSIRHFCLYSTPFIQGWSIVLTALWLKFNWFEPKWFVAGQITTYGEKNNHNLKCLWRLPSHIAFTI